MHELLLIAICNFKRLTFQEPHKVSQTCVWERLRKSTFALAITPRAWLQVPESSHVV